ncbi:MAG: cytochrome c [Thiohalocapsa sp.]|uniref:c-type cytochrome n=1 Tax=Thiohalocapsa sp. TaxID=2497641 RepID=UPI0025D1101A|nr:cytochrome c [Thiohalocapsa sp.]MCG6941571.1 cytochrome c [Thiohalocapsa sp.]
MGSLPEARGSCRRRHRRCGGAGAWLLLMLASAVAAQQTAEQGARADQAAAPEQGSTAASEVRDTARGKARGGGSAANATVERGRYLFHAALCGVCHTAKGGKPLAGGRAIESPFGTFYTSNITPDPDYGIGGWSDEDFVRALSEGVSPSGTSYYPAFPYTSFTKLTREDKLALKAYLDTVEPVAQPNRPHELAWFPAWRWPIGIWKALYFHPGTFQPDPARGDTWNRGAYLAEAATHCAECHSPRNVFGAVEQGARYSGADAGIEGGGTPNITPDKATGIGTWTRSMLAFYLEIGMDPSGDFAGGAMAHVIDEGTAKLTADDRAAIAEYILSLPPIAHQQED